MTNLLISGGYSVMDFIFNFNQAKLCTIKGIRDNKQIKLDMNDVIILDYIVNALCSQTMQHLTSDDYEYVWINRTKLLSDLPILGITSNRLTHIFDKLEYLGLIVRKQMLAPKQKGSKSYFGVTELLISCLNTDCDAYYTLGVKNNTSDNSISISNINNINTKDISEVLKITPNKIEKENLYSSCVSDIESYTDNPVLIQALKDYLAVRMHLKDKSFSRATWKSLLKKLSELATSDFEKIAIVNKSAIKQWASFFTSDNNSDTSSLACNAGVKSVQMTVEEQLKLIQDMERRRANGERVEF